ncbi:phosphatidylinositol kinase Pik1 [Schizosaccharomyces japonicus yFS275]|uniref:Phosphatidylinositol kinase Pik1 n=1 Tax=Schizosaccharomyces japonicus (strain yFS275 / FY16936) TaxID=402676 RepID=B6K6Q4_SCHJY|nr:phosphatidylinositol kinase Pik1 [Schizosaccharomyces japonicus yFS275]EEB09208.2 phosphatidylinositol kinase Pik1 [Schizosaccharomyces japonicus yFS275]
MRAAAVMLAQLDSTGAKRPKSETDAIRHGIIEEMRKLEEERLNESSVAYPNNIDLSLIDNAHPQLSSKTERKGDREDPSAAMFAEDWSVKKERIRRSSPYGHLPNWDLISVIVKTGADLRQETFACQLISVFQNVWAACNEKVWVRSIKILVTGDNSGLVETITNAISIHSIKKNLTRQKANEAIMRGHEPPREVASLKEYFIRQFGPEDTESYRKAQTNFIQSLVAYSVVSYVLQLKDRHNGNILIDTDGVTLCILILGFSTHKYTGKNVGFESAPLTDTGLCRDYW